VNRGHYRPDIDGLRAIAVGAVLAYHAFPGRLAGGFTGVDVFFVISGYLISGIILSALNAGRFSVAHFYARRIRRIFPALAIVLTSVMAAGWFLLYADDYARAGTHVAAGAAFISNFVLWKEASYFDVAANLKPLLHLWSLGVEEQFYLVWPIVLVLASRWRRGPIAATFIIGSISFLVAIYTVRIDRTPAFYAPWTRFWELLAGATLACIEADAILDAWLGRIVSSPLVCNLMGVAGILMIAAGTVLIDATRVFPGLWVMLPVVGTFLLIAAGAGGIVNRTVLSLTPVVWIGLISYPLYLWHWPLLSFARIITAAELSIMLRLALLAASVVLAWATYVMIERPIRFGSRSRAIIPALALAMTAVGASGLAIMKGGGMLDRPINRSDAALLVHYYDRLHKYGLKEAYRGECDFMNWETGAVPDALPPSCTAAGRGHTVLLWGDSFAQALSLGIRENLPSNTSLAQVATSLCRPQIKDFDSSAPDHRCEKADTYAMAAIARIKPDVVILAQSGAHEQTDWAQLTAKILELGAHRVVVVGPSPTWEPTLPRVYADHHMQDHAEYVSTGLSIDRFRVDNWLRGRVSTLPNVTYLSLLDQLCRDGACLARVPGADPLDLMIVDYGHFSPKGSAYLGRAVWKPYLESVVRGAIDR
jgi:peptidoglycan/LPS O-acetylase OafA/YrhL